MICGQRFLIGQLAQDSKRCGQSCFSKTNFAHQSHDAHIRQSHGLSDGSIAHGAAADALEECSSRYAAVAGVADALSVEVTGLQAHITRVVGPVCVAGLEDNIQVGQ